MRKVNQRSKKYRQCEFDNMVTVLRDEGVRVIVIEDSQTPVKTDAVFPNNWVSTHQNGNVYLYPMFSPNRRLERRESVINHLRENYEVGIISRQLLEHEKAGAFLEGTGSMILDRPNKKIYACYSERTHEQLLDEFGKQLDYDVIGFEAIDENGVPYYHTNVIMTLGSKVAILCTESIEDIKEKNNVINSIESSGRQLVDISREQVLHFAGNMLEVQGNDKKPLMVMSEAAYLSLTKEQLYIINYHNKIVYLPLYTIEQFGGGSARCMMAEIFLPNQEV